MSREQILLIALVANAFLMAWNLAEHIRSTSRVPTFWFGVSLTCFLFLSVVLYKKLETPPVHEHSVVTEYAI